MTAPDRHRHPPIPFRPPEGDRAWLLEHADATGQPVNRILTEALTEYRKALMPAQRNNQQQADDHGKHREL